jgi:hypothetical protein
MGDMNNDGLVDLGDAILCSQGLLNEEPTSGVFQEADVNGDRKLGTQEMTYILHRACGLR